MMAGGHGGRRPNSGRKPGLAKKRTAAIRNEAAAKNQLPLEHMLRVMNDPRQPAARRDLMAQMAAPYCHWRLGHVAVSAAAPHFDETGNLVLDLEPAEKPGNRVQNITVIGIPRGMQVNPDGSLSPMNHGVEYPPLKVVEEAPASEPVPVPEVESERVAMQAKAVALSVQSTPELESEPVKLETPSSPARPDFAGGPTRSKQPDYARDWMNADRHPQPSSFAAHIRKAQPLPRSPEEAMGVDPIRWNR
jgi:hypothetical protein